MKLTKNQALKYINESEDVNFLVTILELSAHKTEVNTVSETARINKISPNGVKSSNRYLKISIGKQLMVVPNVENNNLPF